MNRTPDWRDRLVAAYPSLFRTDLDIGVATLQAGDGWSDLVETMLTRIVAAMSTTAGNFVKVDRIETKNGSLVVHFRGLVVNAAVRAAVEEAVDLAEARSATTCETCGANGRLRENRLGWLTTACDEHADGAASIEGGGIAGLVVKRNAAGTIISCRRYVRALDRFVDVDPRGIGFEK